MTGFDARAWLAWVAAAVVTVLSVDQPVVSVVAIAALALVAAALTGRGEGRPAILAFKLGAVFLVARVLLFGLTGHAGDTVLFTLPRAHVPALLGGFELGGRITAEVVTQQLAEGLKIVALLACFGVFLSVCEAYRVLRLLPRFLFEAGLIVTIALAFVPSMLRRAREVRDAQRLRGHRFRGPRALRALVVPVLADGLERSLTLAASMESRGYGRARTGAARDEAVARATVLAGLIAFSLGGGLMLFDRTLAGIPLVSAGGVALVLGLSQLSGLVERTRFRPDRPDPWDRAMIVASVLLAVAALAARSIEGAHWASIPLRAPSFDLRLIALGAFVAFPVIVSSSRAWFLDRANPPLEVRTESAR